MSFQQFAGTQTCKSCDTSEIIQMGGCKPRVNLELVYIRASILIYKQANLAGSEQFRTKVYSDSGYTSLLYTSSWMSINSTSISGLASTHSWIGIMRSDFSSRPQMSAQLYYYIGLEFQNYTRNANTFWIGTCRDFPYPTYSTAQVAYLCNYKFEVFGYQAQATGQ